MRSLSLLITLLFAFVATSYAWPSASFSALEPRKDRNGTRGDGNGNGNGANKACKTLNKLTKLTELAANQTLLDEKVAANKLTTEKVEEIKAKAANATAELQTMQANTTLVQECAVFNAQRADVKACKMMNKLQRLSEMAGNSSAVAEKAQEKGLDDAKVQKLMEKIQGAAAKLQEMQANTTLTTFCAQRAEQKQGSGNGNSDSASSGSSEAASGSGAGTDPQASTGGASSLTMQTVPVVLASGLTALFVFFL